MEIFILDNMIFDKIAEDEHLQRKILELKDSQKIRLLITSVQKYQLERMPDTKKTERELFIELANEMCEWVPAPNFIAGISRAGIDMVGDSEFIFTISEHERTGKQRISRNKLAWIQDESIALTAKCYMGFLVTEEKKLISRVKENIPEVQALNFQGFSEKLNNYSTFQVSEVHQ